MFLDYILLLVVVEPLNEVDRGYQKIHLPIPCHPSSDVKIQAVLDDQGQGHLGSTLVRSISSRLKNMLTFNKKIHYTILVVLAVDQRMIFFKEDSYYNKEVAVYIVHDCLPPF